MIDRIKVILKSHEGKKNAISSKAIASEIGIVEDDTHSKTRTLILKCIEKYELPVVANNRGYYLISNQADYDEYIENLNSRIQGINDRKEIIHNNYEKWMAKNEIHIKK